MTKRVTFGWEWNHHDWAIGLAGQFFTDWWMLGIGVGPLHFWAEKA